MSVGGRRHRARRSTPVACAPVAGLGDLPAGPGLAAALAGLALAGLTGYELVLVLQARNRQANHERALLLCTAGEVMRRIDPDFGRAHTPAGGDGHEPDEVGAAEVRAALRLTRRSANSVCALAADLLGRLPTVLAAMLDGTLDQARGRILSLWTADLSAAHTAAVVAAVLPRAGELTTAQLIDAIQQAAIAVDPEWARRRYTKAVQGRRVQGRISPDGTGLLAGYDLPADQTAAACDRLDAIARHLKRAGHPDPIDTIRADIYLGLQECYSATLPA